MAERLELSLPADLSALALAREAVRRAVNGVAADTSAAELVVSELVSNAVRHGEAPVRLRVEGDAPADELTITVSDAGSGTPALRTPEPGAAGGRGLLLVEAMSQRWGVDRTDGGISVWAIVPTAAA